MIRRIAVFGAESTGKSALAAALARHYGEPWAEEYVRGFWERRAGRIEPWDLATIARGQIANEEAAARAARRLVFCDTDLLTNVLWADVLYGGRIADWVRREAEVRARKYTLYLYCAPDLPWQADPQRCFADQAQWLASAARCRQVLDTRGLPVAVVSGQGTERWRSAVAAVDRVLGGQVAEV